MSSNLYKEIPEELLDIISELIMYEDKCKENQIDNFTYEYAYDYVDSIYIDTDESDKDPDPTIIKISL